VQLSSQATAVVSFVQGLAFFTLGISILVAVRPTSALVMARSMWLLAAFGFLHSLSAWVEFVRQLESPGTPLGEFLGLARSALLVLCSVALAQFGANVISALSPRHHWLRLVPAALFAWWFPTAIIVGYEWHIGTAEAAQIEAIARYIIYLPGALLSALALYMQGRALSSERLTHVERDCRHAGLAFAVYAVGGGLIVPTKILLGSRTVDGQTLAAFAELPIEILRLLLAPILAVLIVRTLRVFEFEHYLEVEDLNRQLRWLSRAAVTAQENERKRIARELHDETAQLLSSLLVRLKLLSNVQSLCDIEKRSAELMQLASEATQSVRRMAFQLRPAALDDLGLVTALQWYVDDYISREGVKVDFSARGFTGRINPEVELCVYRVVQESLKNVAKHAKATRVRVHLEHDKNALTATVEDDGCGFDTATLQRTRNRGLGIIGMRERAAFAGGRLEVESQPGRGTTVRVIVPRVDQSGGTNAKDQSTALRRSPGTEARRSRSA
jgi:signal transduction histidine kinase